LKFLNDSLIEKQKKCAKIVGKQIGKQLFSGKPLRDILVPVDVF